VVSRGRCELGRGGTQIDPIVSLLKVVICGLSAGTCMSCWLGLYPYGVCY
jgi:hypothetical protein